ncbi:TIGR03773 family transporter-associated surface protein [Streptomyces ficellus]|uniref:TIGR03773 family transporter-associated surface protein n=1 Tax=Streptomyces ficellus TaxID=1977088 RepID=A0ABT7ZAH3_9ACTN|nr:TIGR03773 family transporter-associated surface protein [Streptomyces ficellus]MDN3296508.1 TIGR03773 family transporter-associated surface protein [Streptomyces ficellus]
MRLVRNSRVALAAAGFLALGGTAMTVPPGEEEAAVPVVAPVTLVDGVLSLGTGGVLDIDDTHRVTGPDDTAAWELTPAWDTTGLPTGAVRGDGVRWSLTGVEGPGALKVYEPGSAPDREPVVRFDSTDGLPDGYDLPTGARGETRWVFDRPGTYQLTLAAEAESDGGPLVAETRYTMRVGDAAVAAPLPPAPPAAPASPSPTAPVAGAPADAGEDRRPATPSLAGAGPAVAAQRVIAAAEPVETAKKVLDQGHIDLAARVADGKMQVHIKDGTVPGKTVWREPSSVVLHVKPQARKVIPAAKDFAFLGKAGDPVWLLDQVQQPGLLWPGWSTDNMAAGATKGEVEFKLVKADGPGNFALYNYDGLSGATVRFNSADGVPDAFGVPQNTHAHGGWAFGKEGVYRLTFAMSGTLANGTKVSDTETIAFAVGATDPNGVQVGGSGSTGGSSTGGTATGGGSTGGTTGGSGTAGATGGSTTSGTTGATTGGTTGGSTGGSTGGGAMASTGAGSSLLFGGTAAGLVAAGAGAVYLTRRRTA